MTERHERVLPYSPDEIRKQEFTHRVRGLDEYEVREFLEVLADQVQVFEMARADDLAEMQHLRAEVEELRRRASSAADGEVTPQAVMLFSQAQQVADQLVEEAVRHARDLMASARDQQREILEEAHGAADSAVRRIGAVRPGGTMEGGSSPAEEIEYVRTFARVAQVQLRSVLDALNEQVDKLGEVPTLSGAAQAETGKPGGPAAPAVPNPRRSE